MGSFSDFLELEVLDHVVGNAAYTAPANLYFAAFTAAPTDAGGGTEVSTGGYARKSMTNNATNFPAAAAGAKTNATAITFVTASGANWGTIVAIGVFDASTTGNLLMWDDFTGVVINDGDTLEIPIGSFDVTLD
jgi:hypothetical protein